MSTDFQWPQANARSRRILRQVNRRKRARLVTRRGLWNALVATLAVIGVFTVVQWAAGPMPLDVRSVEVRGK